MTDALVNLQIGSVLQLQRISPEHEERYSVKLIGYLPGNSLVVTTPTVNGKVQLLAEGQRYAVRMLHGSDIQGFVATILSISSKPYPHLHISYPEAIESIAVRNAERVDINIPGLAHNTHDPDSDEYWHPILIKDLSLTGMRLESLEPLGRKGEALQLTFQLKVCGGEEQLNLLGKIRNRNLKGTVNNDDDPRHSTGLSFLQVNRMQEIIVGCHVLEQIAWEDMT